uniref:Uncharacterized protein n=1 Tax=Anguilla anguilla TaxID=7936 RepID=A0A0E9SYW0_ANGAN
MQKRCYYFRDKILWEARFLITLTY